jgi:hypothetical protein
MPTSPSDSEAATPQRTRQQYRRLRVGLWIWTFVFGGAAFLIGEELLWGPDCFVIDTSPSTQLRASLHPKSAYLDLTTFAAGDPRFVEVKAYHFRGFPLRGLASDYDTWKITSCFFFGRRTVMSGGTPGASVYWIYLPYLLPVVLGSALGMIWSFRRRGRLEYRPGGFPLRLGNELDVLRENSDTEARSSDGAE